MTDRDAASDPERLSPWWHVAVVGVSVVSLTLLAVTQGPDRAAVPAAAVGVLLLSWFTFGRRALDGGRGSAALVAVVLVVASVGTAYGAAFAAIQTVAFPLIWSAVVRLRPAVAANVALALAVAIGYSIATHGAIVEAVIVESLSLGFSLVMGLWITKISTLSAQRHELIERLSATQEELAALSRAAGVTSERERLSRELHDTIAQSLTAIVMLAERARAGRQVPATLATLEETARDALAEARGLVASMAPVALDGGLAAAIERLGERFGRETGTEVVVRVHADVPRGVEVVLLRCAQEGLANVRKHARAVAVTITAELVGSEVELVVEDDGIGVGGDPAVAGFGLAGMRDRVGLVGGEVQLANRQPRGARLTVRVPVSSRVDVP